MRVVAGGVPAPLQATHKSSRCRSRRCRRHPVPRPAGGAARPAGARGLPARRSMLFVEGVEQLARAGRTEGGIGGPGGVRGPLARARSGSSAPPRRRRSALAAETSGLDHAADADRRRGARPGGDPTGARRAARPAREDERRDRHPTPHSTPCCGSPRRSNTLPLPVYFVQLALSRETGWPSLIIEMFRLAMSPSENILMPLSVRTIPSCRGLHHFTVLHFGDVHGRDGGGRRDLRGSLHPRMQLVHPDRLAVNREAEVVGDRVILGAGGGLGHDLVAVHRYHLERHHLRRARRRLCPCGCRERKSADAQGR